MSDERVSGDLGSLHGLFAAGLEALGEPADPAVIDRWVRFAGLLERWSSRINLTGHRGAHAIARRLLLEAVALHRALPPAASIADLGSGAGVPGLPLALCRPESRILLVESRERRHYFQRAAIRDLDLRNVHPLRGRAESLHPDPCEGVVSQALAASPRALAWMLPWTAPGGWLAIAGSPPQFDPGAMSHPDLENGQLVPYGAPDGPARAAWVAWRRPRRG